MHDDLCLRCGTNPADLTVDGLHCEPCWQIVQDETHDGLAVLDNIRFPNCDRFDGVRFHVYGNIDGTCHVLLVDDNGGYIFADRLNEEDAEWAAAAFNAVLSTRTGRAS